MAELTVEDLHLRYGDNPILKGVSLTLERGQVVSLLITAVAAPVIGADVVRAGDLWWGALSGVGTCLGMAFLFLGSCLSLVWFSRLP